MQKDKTKTLNLNMALIFWFWSLENKRYMLRKLNTVRITTNVIIKQKSI